MVVYTDPDDPDCMFWFIPDVKRRVRVSEEIEVEHTFSDGCGFVDEEWLSD